MARCDNKASFLSKDCSFIQDDQLFIRYLSLSSLIKRSLRFAGVFGFPSSWANELYSLIFTLFVKHILNLKILHGGESSREANIFKAN